MANRNQVQIGPVSNTITVSQAVTETVKITTIGPQGPVGPVGPQGPSGSLYLTGSINNDVIITGSMYVTGSLAIIGPVNGNFTGSLLGTASNAISSSYALSSSYSVDASSAQTASYVETAQTASYILNAVSSSYALSSSYSVNASFAQTASYIESAQSASYVLNAISSSYALSSSYAFSASFSETASYAETAQTASYVLNAVSASFAQTASYVNQLIQGVQITGSLGVTDSITAATFTGSFSGSFEGDGSGLTQIPASGIVGLNLTQIATANITASVSEGADSFRIVSGSTTPFAIKSGSGNISASGDLSIKGFPSVSESLSSAGKITYDTASGGTFDLTNIQVNDYDDNVAINFVDGKLTFTFGAPEVPSSVNSSLSGFAIDRFNKVTDSYTINGTWSNGGYTLISASLYEDSNLLEEVGTGTSLSFNTTTSGSHTYRLEYTASSPLDGSLYKTTDTVTGTLSKSNPGNPSITSTPTVQLGATSNQIEQGATGSITFSAAYGSANGWDEVSISTNPSTSPISVTDSNTGSLSISISATSNYQSPAGENDPQLSTSRNTTTTYSKIRSVRYGASAASSFTQSELETLSDWDTTLGGSVGTIDKGNTNPSGDSITITWSGDKYHYIVFDSNRSNLTNITTGGFGVLGQFSVTTVGDYKVYKTNTLQAGGSSTNITYTLT